MSQTPVDPTDPTDRDPVRIAHEASQWASAIEHAADRARSEVLELGAQSLNNTASPMSMVEISEAVADVERACRRMRNYIGLWSRS